MKYRDLIRTHFPYCLMRQQDGRYVLVNRNYKPLGFDTNEWAIYEQFPIAVKIRQLGPREAARISYSGKADVDDIYLYNDGCAPWISPQHFKAYLARLERVARLKIK